MVSRRLIVAMIACLCCAGAQAVPLPEAGHNVHEGVASCANAQCHGKIAVDPTSTVQLNEYTVWRKNDKHSATYNILKKKQSQRMASKLGLPSAETAKICLDCHTDNVAEKSRGARFQITDGVGCEACHGGGGKWLESHAEKGTSHADNLAKGMYPTEEPMDRARLCLSCHLGTRDKFATHAIMGAGHPRLAFDLEVFTQNQPRHYTVDKDYKDRKPFIPSVNMWLAGLLVSSMQTMELLESNLFTQPTMTPELSFYHCYTCHRPLNTLQPANDLRWQAEGGAAALPPGAVRLNDASLLVLQSVLQILSNPQAGALESSINALHSASMTDRAAVVAQAKKLHSLLSSLEAPLIKHDYSAEQMKALRMGLVKRAADGRFRHYITADQVMLAVETLNIVLGDDGRLTTQMDNWFDTITKPEGNFDPARFAGAAGALMGAL